MSTTAIPDAAELAELERVAVLVASEAGRLITDDRPEDLGTGTKSSTTDVVTSMDRASQRLIRARLAELRPGEDFFGEEDGVRPDGGSTITWVVDPIDGTVNYLYRIPAYAVSVAAVVGDPLVPGGWTPVAGAVVDPERGEVFSAHRGGGARRTRQARSESLAASGEDDPGLALVATGFSYDAGTRGWQGDVVRHLLPHIRDIRRFGSAALDLCHVAAGRVDAYYERWLNPWDVAAGWLIATEAGARVGGSAPADGPDGAPGPELSWAAAPALAASFARLLDDAITAAGSAPERV